ncbi:hypothetical protein J7E49_21990 [Variovorax paradoxus]|nr:hypothetical protein [Variovorax paradoxus]
MAAVQLSIAIGSTVGGLLFDASGYQRTFIASAPVLLLATLLAFLTSRAQAPQADWTTSAHRFVFAILLIMLGLSQFLSGVKRITRQTGLPRRRNTLRKEQ